MTVATVLDWTAIASGIGSAGLWFASARVKFQFGYDMDAELHASMRRASMLNAWAAACAAISVAATAIKSLLATLKNWLSISPYFRPISALEGAIGASHAVCHAL